MKSRLIGYAMAGLLFCAAALAMDYIAAFTAPPQGIPTSAMPGGPLLGNGDIGVVLAGPPEAQSFYIGKNDFWRRNNASVITVGAVTLSTPQLQGATYRQEQDLALAEVRGSFRKGDAALQTRSFVDANSNLLVTEVKSTGKEPMTAFVLKPRARPDMPDKSLANKVIDNDNKVNVGREQYQHFGNRWYFHGSIADAKVEAKALSAQEIAVIARAGVKETNARVYDGKGTFQVMDVPKVDSAVSVSAWIMIESCSDSANYIVSKGEWNQAYSLGLSRGCLRWSINGFILQSDQPLELKKWIHVAGTFNDGKMGLYLDGKQVKRAPSESRAPNAGSEACIVSFTRKADNLAGKSREAAVVTRIVGGAQTMDDTGALRVTLKTGEVACLVSAILSDMDDPDFLNVAKKRVLSLGENDIAVLSARHRQWWKDFWSRSSIEIPDKEIEKRWYAALYVLGSCSRAGKVAPGLWGNWATTDGPNWHGDFHLNYNFQAPYYIAYSSNHADLTTPFYQAIVESLPNGRAMAKSRGWKGVQFPVCIGPWGLLPEGFQDWGQRSNASYAALNFIWHYQYTQDKEFLRTTAYPYLLEVAAFWEDYLKLENGRYVIRGDAIHEGSGDDMNPILSLGLVKNLFKNLIVMSKDLGVDEGRRAKWQDILDKLSPFPLQERNGKTVFRYTEKGMAWCDGNTLGIQHIFPCDAIGLDGDPKLLEISRNMIGEMGRWADYNGFSSWYTACARVGYDPKVILAKMREECDKHSLPNLLLYYGGGGIESSGGFVAINEMLLQSHEGVIRLFPCWPRDQDARFGTLRAVGAFLVSAELKGGVVTNVTIVSEKGRPCTVQNPWPGTEVRVVRNGKAKESVSGERWTLATVPGEVISFAPVAKDNLPHKAPAISVERWRDWHFGMFIHWGPVSLTEKELSWSRSNTNPQCPNNGPTLAAEYDVLYKKFVPNKFNATEWVATAKAAGMKYMVLTVRHCDGFLLWDSKVSDYNIMHTPFNRDICAELAKAARAAGMGIGWYFSPPDWRDPDCRTAKNTEFVKRMQAELTELLTQYGKIDILWFDCDGASVPWEQDATYALVRRLQPGIVINNRLDSTSVGYSASQIGPWADFYTPELNIGEFDNQRPWESCMTVSSRGQWAWGGPADGAKPGAECLGMLIRCAGAGGDVLLNVGPRPDGVIDPAQASPIKEVGTWLEKYGESIYGTRAGPFKPGAFGVCTCKRNAIYLHILNWPGDTLELRDIPATIVRGVALTGGIVTVKQADGRLLISLTACPRQPVDTLVKLELDRLAVLCAPIVVQGADGSVLLKADDADLSGSLRCEIIDGKSSIGCWFDPKDTARWAFKVTKPGKYRVTAEVAAPSASKFEVRLGGDTLPATTSATESYQQFQQMTIGEIRLASADRVTLNVVPVVDGWQAVNLRSIALQCVE